MSKTLTPKQIEQILNSTISLVKNITGFINSTFPDFLKSQECSDAYLSWLEKQEIKKIER